MVSKLVLVPCSALFLLVSLPCKSRLFRESVDKITLQLFTNSSDDCLVFMYSSETYEFAVPDGFEFIKEKLILHAIWYNSVCFLFRCLSHHNGICNEVEISGVIYSVQPFGRPSDVHNF